MRLILCRMGLGNSRIGLGMDWRTKTTNCKVIEVVMMTTAIGWGSTLKTLFGQPLMYTYIVFKVVEDYRKEEEMDGGKNQKAIRQVVTSVTTHNLVQNYLRYPESTKE